jgi:hypothetical protein
LVFLLRPPALRSIPYVRQRTSSIRSVSRVSIYHPKSLNADPRAGAIHRTTTNRARTNRRLFSHSFPVAFGVFRIVASASRPAHHAAAGFRSLPPRLRVIRVMRVPRCPPPPLPAHRSRTTSFASRLPRSFVRSFVRSFRSFHYAPSCVCRRATQKDGWVARKALCVLSAVEIVRHQCKI